VAKIETIEDLEKIVADQTAAIRVQTAAIHALGELVKGIDARVKLLTALVDSHHETLIKHGMAKPRPKGD
jgi:hypothetical protein